jgi:ribonuclease P protein component
VNHTFSKNEKLKSRKTIQQLFEEGLSEKKYPLRLLYLYIPDGTHHQAAFAVPKRNFKRAVDRNRIKRQLREAYRVQKHLLPANKGTKFALLFLYLGKDKPGYEQLEKAVRSLLKKLPYEST